MERIPHFWQNSLIKIVIISGLALLMLIPLSMIRKQVDERSAHHEQAESDITDNWGCGQTFTGPWIVYDLPNGKNKIYELLPDSLKYVVHSSSQELHRSIYDFSVYTAEVSIKGPSS